MLNSCCRASTEELSGGHRSVFGNGLFLNFGHMRSQASSWDKAFYSGLEKMQAVSPWILNILFQAVMILHLERLSSAGKDPVSVLLS